MPICPHDRNDFMRVIIANGSEQIRKRCLNCGELFGTAVGRATFHPNLIKAMPVLVGETDRVCAVCGKRETEEHHFMPRSIAASFGLDADAWPKAWLCREHHSIWHRLVTPFLGKKK